MNKTLKEILELDVESDEFFEVYQKISEKYWDFKGEESDLQMAAKQLVMFAERCEANQVIMAHKIVAQIMIMASEKSKAANMHLAFEDSEYYIDIAENEVEKDRLNKMMDTVLSSMNKSPNEIFKSNPKEGRK